MITASNIRYLGLGLALGFVMAICLFAPKDSSPPPRGAKMSVVVNNRNLVSGIANPVIIPAAPNKGMFPVKVEIRKFDNESDIDRAIRRAAQQKYHLIYREVPPIE